MVGFALDELMDDGGSVALQLRIGWINEGFEGASGCGVVVEGYKDSAKVLGVGCVERGAKGGRVAALGEGEVVKVLGNDRVFLGHAVEELLAEDFGGGLEWDGGAARGVGGARVGTVKAASASDADVSVAAVEGDRRGDAVDVDARHGMGGPQIEEEAAAGGLVKAAVGFLVDEEVHVNAVAVRPAGGQSGAAAEAKVLLAAEGLGERAADGVKEFPGASGKIELGHRSDGNPFDDVADDLLCAPVVAALLADQKVRNEPWSRRSWRRRLVTAPTSTSKKRRSAARARRWFETAGASSSMKRAAIPGVMLARSTV